MSRYGKTITLIVLMVIICSAPYPSHAEGVAGFELDALPYLTGGYYGSFWYGIDGWRVRAVVSHVAIPSFAVKEGFDNAENNAAALIVDRFYGNSGHNFVGPWIGGGIERWDNTIGREGKRGVSRYSTTMATIGGGYVWAIGRGFTINPWAACHYALAGYDVIDVAGVAYKPDRFLYEASLKIGYSFR